MWKWIGANAFITVLLLPMATNLYPTTYETWLEYEPKVVTLVGKVVAKTFPGPPNYEDVKKGDRPERVLLLVLDRPISVKGKVPDPEGLYPTVRDIHQVQLWVPEGRSRVWGRLKKVVGKRVAVTGRLSHAITGHHRTPIQMEVIRFQVRDRRKAASRTP